jgi:hypothetical protein
MLQWMFVVRNINMLSVHQLKNLPSPTACSAIFERTLRSKSPVADAARDGDLSDGSEGCESGDGDGQEYEDGDYDQDDDLGEQDEGEGENSDEEQDFSQAPEQVQNVTKLTEEQGATVSALHNILARLSAQRAKGTESGHGAASDVNTDPAGDTEEHKRSGELNLAKLTVGSLPSGNDWSRLFTNDAAKFRFGAFEQDASAADKLNEQQEHDLAQKQDITVSPVQAPGQSTETTGCQEHAHGEGVKSVGTQELAPGEDAETTGSQVQAPDDGAESVDTQVYAPGESTDITGSQEQAPDEGAESSGTLELARVEGVKSVDSQVRAPGESTETTGWQEHAQGAGGENVDSHVQPPGEGVESDVSDEQSLAKGVEAAKAQELAPGEGAAVEGLPRGANNAKDMAKREIVVRDVDNAVSHAPEQLFSDTAPTRQSTSGARRDLFAILLADQPAASASGAPGGVPGAACSASANSAGDTEVYKLGGILSTQFDFLNGQLGTAKPSVHAVDDTEQGGDDDDTQSPSEEDMSDWDDDEEDFEVRDSEATLDLYGSGAAVQLPPAQWIVKEPMQMLAGNRLVHFKDYQELLRTPHRYDSGSAVKLRWVRRFLEHLCMQLIGVNLVQHSSFR